MIFSPFAYMAQAAGGDADANAYIAAIGTAGGTLTSAEEGYIQTLFTDLKSAGIYSNLTRMYPLVGGVEAAHAINAVDRDWETIINRFY